MPRSGDTAHPPSQAVTTDTSHASATDTPARNRPTRAVLQVLRGFAMGSADLVPGVSGGTIALVFGIYDELVAAIYQASSTLGRLLRFDLDGAWRALRNVRWAFLVPLVAGIGLAVVTLAGILRTLLAERPVLMSAFFFGLIVGSIMVASDELDPRDVPRVTILTAVAAATFALLGLRGPAISAPGLAVMFAGGALAITAMILPGVSGSFILLMVGLYQHLLGVVHERDVVELGVFTAGAATGLAVFSTALHWLLEHHRPTVMATLIGLMAGSLRVLWMWPADQGGVGDVRLGAPVWADVPLVVAVALVGAVAVVVIARLGLRRGESLGVT